MSLRTPLGKVLGLGTAKDGTDHWWSQRISAVALLLLGLWFAGSLSVLDSLAHATVVDFVAQPLNGVLLALLCVTVAYHSYLGVQVVIEDYVHAAGFKIFALVASRFAHVFVAVLSVYAVLRIGFSA
jgi:succinate dehydrogenase / fumarate reductase membrane anchor subunit